jgi:flagellar L-ring protein FlgH
MSCALTLKRGSALAICCLTAALLLPAGAAAKKKQENQNKSAAAYDQALDDYIRQASRANPNTPATVGSLWNPGGSLAALGRDDKAARVGDLITIDILETTTAQATGSNKSSRAFSASSGINAFYGTLNPAAKITNLFSPQSQDSTNGASTTSSSHMLSTNLTGTIVNVLPNGYMVVQAARDVYVDNQRQHVILRGIVRPSDLSPDNIVLSTAVANLQVEVQGKGVISDETRPPNSITRLLLKLVGF